MSHGRWLVFVTIWSSVIAGARAQAPVPVPLASPTAADLAGGEKTFVAYCARCHGINGTGGSAPPLARPVLRRAADEAAIIDILMKGIPGTAMMAAWSLSEPEMQQVTAYVRALGRRPVEALTGDPVRGQAVYARLACATCHIVAGEGSGVGPELSDIGNRRGSAFLREAILDPAAARPERPVPYEPYVYAAYVIVRAQPSHGSEVSGIRVNEDAFTIQIRDEQGRLHSLRKRDLTRLLVDSGASVMPGYRDALDAAELDDLVAYLMSRRSAR